MKAYEVSFRWDFNEFDDIIGYYFSKAKAEEMAEAHDKTISNEDVCGCSDAIVKEIEIEGEIPSEIKEVKPNTTVKT